MKGAEMKIAIVDDELFWRSKVESLLEEYDYFKADKPFDKFSSGEEFNYDKEYDVIFLDIEMNGIDGFETAKRYRENYEDTIIVILTTHVELMNRGYMISAFRYIDKANIENEMKEAIEAIQYLQTRNYHLVFRELHRGEIGVPLKDILYFETEKRNVVIHTKERDYLTNRTMDDLEEELKERGFFRSHKSFLVNLNNVKDFDRTKVYFRDNKRAYLSGRRYPQLKEKYILQKHKMANS